MAYRFYLDESGDHFRDDPDDVGARYLGVVGVMLEDSIEGYWSFSDALDSLKREHLPYHPDDPPILHRREIIDASGPFHVLQDEQSRADFDDALLELIASTSFTIIGVVIDKHEHGGKEYRSLTHPYHYCMEALLERFCGLLDFIGTNGEVIAEARGGRENRALRSAYRTVLKNGTRYMDAEQVERTLQNRGVDIRGKDDNIAGLQLPDLLAQAVTRDVLEAFGQEESVVSNHDRKVVELVTPKYNSHYPSGRINGYGRVFLD